MSKNMKLISDSIILKIEGLKRVEVVGYPVPQDEYSSDVEPVYFLTDDMCFRLGSYSFENQTFWSHNGLGGEVWEKESIIAWAYLLNDEECDTVTVSELTAE